ncbi:MAG: ribonuclease D [Gammaproteobacteria bacterium]|nr:ribonuclease D [Gammaproteobacteria bacterium]
MHAPVEKDSVNKDDLFIDTPQGLTSLCAHLQDAEWIALDTEFIRERTYYPRLCLLQIATPTLVACIDPLALDSLSPLLDVIYDTRIIKVLHAAHQDLEILYQLRGEPARPVFDTQIASSLLGFGEQVGYANLVQQILGVALSKTHTRSDWSERPLDAEQIHYAADDVRYLSVIYPRLQTMLADKGRLDWLTDDFERLQRADTFEIDAVQVWRRIGGIQKLSSGQLNVLRALAAWREREAAHRDKPRKWILPDPALVDLSRQTPRDQTALARMRGLQPHQVQRYGATLIDTIAHALQEPEATWPGPPARLDLTPAQDAMVDVLMALVRAQAAQFEVSPAALSTRNALERLVAGDTDVPVLQGWRARLAGRTLQKMLAGELGVRFAPDGLKLEETGSGAA